MDGSLVGAKAMVTGPVTFKDGYMSPDRSAWETDPGH